MPTYTVDDVTLHYAEYGSADGLPVMLLHAFPLSGGMWQPQAEALVASLGCHVIVPDLRGSGASSVPLGPYPMERMAADVLALADHLGLASFVLGGLSMGGYVSFAVLRAAPDRLRALILADTRPGADTADGQRAREGLAQLAEREGAAPIAETMLPNLLSATGLASGAIPDRVRALILANSGAGIAGAARGMALRPDASDLLPTIACPTLIIVGEQDLVTPPHFAQTMFESIPNATLQVISDAGHLSNMEQPDAFADIVEHFLRALPTAS
ncbi:MAG: alpha/beta fold hydrolase [Ktedonobacterales bacterium]|nr:alpha/beta fold hydrolase [Ktedonobacterales bacterium]